jgi:hypothetical protein
MKCQWSRRAAPSHSTTAAVPLGAAVLIYIFGFLSRFFHENYLGFIIALATIGTIIAISPTLDSIGEQEGS